MPDFTAKLYSGYTEGGINAPTNTQPPSYHLQQFARDIQVRPLMQDLRYGNISGRGDTVVDITLSSNHSQLIRPLNGDT